MYICIYVYICLMIIHNPIFNNKSPVIYEKSRIFSEKPYNQ